MRFSLVFLNAARRGAAFLLPLKRGSKFHYHRQTEVSTSAGSRAGPRGPARPCAQSGPSRGEAGAEIVRRGALIGGGKFQALVEKRWITMHESNR
jgi:hypothetical protein